MRWRTVWMAGERTRKKTALGVQTEASSWRSGIKTYSLDWEKNNWRSSSSCMKAAGAFALLDESAAKLEPSSLQGNKAKGSKVNSSKILPSSELVQWP